MKTRVYILWHVDLLLGNDREISKYKTVVAKVWPLKSNRGTVFSAWSAPMTSHATMTQEQ
jgi:hypothetical protein